MAEEIVPRQRLFYTKDHSRLVPEHSTEAAFLCCIPGRKLFGAEAEAYRSFMRGSGGGKESEPNAQAGDGKQDEKEEAPEKAKGLTMPPRKSRVELRFGKAKKK